MIYMAKLAKSRCSPFASLQDFVPNNEPIDTIASDELIYVPDSLQTRKSTSTVTT